MRGLSQTNHTFLLGSALDVLLSLPERSVHCCVTSPPYWNLRSYLPEDSSDKSLELGSEPTCECNAGESVPCTVLDPFAGAGTTALAAKRLGRSSLNIELSEEYLALAQARLDGNGELTTPGPVADWFANATPKGTP